MDEKLYRVNQIFYTLQGEGHNTGRAAAFVRFAGCNLRCPFCDTTFDAYQEMAAGDIVQAISPYPTRFVVLTGGEPTLQAGEALVEQLHRHGYEVAMESNGTRPAPKNVDWLTVSPKACAGEQVRKGMPGSAVWPSEERRLPDELKIVFDENTDPESFLPRSASEAAAPSARSTPHLYLQPCDTGDPERNAAITARCVDYIKQHPWWRLSLQTHKLIGIE